MSYSASKLESTCYYTMHLRFRNSSRLPFREVFGFPDHGWVVTVIDDLIDYRVDSFDAKKADSF